MLDVQQPELEIVGEPGGATFDPAASILDDVRAAARRPWAYDILPKDFLILSGLSRKYATPQVQQMEPIQQHQLQILNQPSGNMVPNSLFDLNQLANPDEAGNPDAGHATGSTDETSPDPGTLRTRKVPPTNPKLKKKYFTLRGMANNVRQQHPKQAHALDAQTDALMEEVPDDAPGRARPASPPPVKNSPTARVQDVDLTWLALKRGQIEKLAQGTSTEQERARGLLAMLAPMFEAVGEPLPTVPAAAVIVLSDYQSQNKEHQDDKPATNSQPNEQLAA